MARDDDEEPMCRRCNGRGWVGYKVVVVDGHETAVLDLCECPKGQQLAKDQREREARFAQYAGATRQG